MCHSYVPCTSGKENEMRWEPLSILTIFFNHFLRAHLWNCTWRRGEQLRLANTVYGSIPRVQLVRLDIHEQKRNTQLISLWHLLAQRQRSSILQHSLHTPRNCRFDALNLIIHIIHILLALNISLSFYQILYILLYYCIYAVYHIASISAICPPRN